MRLATLQPVFAHKNRTDKNISFTQTFVLVQCSLISLMYVARLMASKMMKLSLVVSELSLENKQFFGAFPDTHDHVRVSRWPRKLLVRSVVSIKCIVFQTHMYLLYTLKISCIALHIANRNEPMFD